MLPFFLAHARWEYPVFVGDRRTTLLPGEYVTKRVVDLALARLLSVPIRNV